MDPAQLPPPLPDPKSERRVGFGVGFIVVWLLLHGAWAAVMLGGGVLAEGAVKIFGGLFVACLTNKSPSQTIPDSELFAWTPLMQTGLIIASVAGIPWGLSYFLLGQKKRLRWIAFALWVIGAACELVAGFILAGEMFR
jgi:hypothetical protein